MVRPSPVVSEPHFGGPYRPWAEGMVLGTVVQVACGWPANDEQIKSELEARNPRSHKSPRDDT